jgi:hypothetical protein
MRMTSVFGVAAFVSTVLLLKDGWYFIGRLRWSGWFRYRVARECEREAQRHYQEHGGRLPPTPFETPLVVFESWSLVLSLVGLAISAVLAR